MTVKEIAKQTIDNLPTNKSYDDIINTTYIKTKFEQALNEVLSGKGIQNDEVIERLKSTLSKYQK